MIKKIPYPEELKNRPITTVTEVGEQLRVSVVDYRPKTNPIIRLDDDHYKVRSTGEVKLIKHGSTRLDAKETLRRSFKALRDIIDCNINPKNRTCVHWVTLTYAENMTDHKQLYEDFRRFNQRLKYFVKTSIPKYSYEYIVVAEPQARGAWHMHLILIWNQKAPYIKNRKLAEIWGHGFVKINTLRGNIRKVSQYLCAYLTDIPLDEAQQCDSDTFSDMKNITVKKVKDKSIVKGARLELYPANCRLFRCSKGVKHPVVRKELRYQTEHYLTHCNAELVSKIAYVFYTDTGAGNIVGKTIYDISPAARRREVRRRYYANLRYLSELNEEAEYLSEDAHASRASYAREIEYISQFYTSNYPAEPLPVTDEELKLSRRFEEFEPHFWL